MLNSLVRLGDRDCLEKVLQLLPETTETIARITCNASKVHHIPEREPRARSGSGNETRARLEMAHGEWAHGPAAPARTRNRQASFSRLTNLDQVLAGSGPGWYIRCCIYWV